MPSPALLVGTSISGRGDARDREAAAQQALARLSDDGLAMAVNLSFTNDTSAVTPVETLAHLTLDAPTVTGSTGPRKPVVTEILDVLAAEAARRGCSRIGLVNADVVVTPEAIARDAESGRPAVAISRTDTGGGEADANLLFGVDMITFDREFWRRQRHRFRAYLLGEPIWDNVFASIAVCHGGALLNRDRLLLHPRHPSVTAGSPYRSYLQVLAARDSFYFTAWCRYVDRVQALRARGGSADEESALQRETFVPPGPVARAIDGLRGSWSRMKRATRA